MAITKRLVKGSPLTAQEFDGNIEEIENNAADISALQSNQNTGVYTVTNFSDLPPTGTANVSYKVTNDSVQNSNNGFYTWDGSVYVKDAELVEQTVEENNTSVAVSGKAVFDSLEPLNIELGVVLGLSNIIPNNQDALFWLNGEIQGDYFVDKSGNGRHFQIVGKDFAEDWNLGFPYKSKAKIKAPAGDAVLISNDVNNFLYNGSGVPNEIPVVSFFQNIDYEDKLFCKHIESFVNVVTGLENEYSYIKDIVLYNSARTGVLLSTCEGYFSVPLKVDGSKWCDYTNGDDSTGTGEKDNPYKTIKKAIAESAANGTVYVKTSEYIEARTFDHLWVNVDVNIISIGRVRLRSTNSTDNVFSYAGSASGIIKGVWFVHGSENYIINHNTNGIVDFCYLEGGVISTVRSVTTTNDPVISNSVLISGNKPLFSTMSNFKISKSYLNSSYGDNVVYIDGGEDVSIENCKIVLDGSGAFLVENNGLNVTVLGCDIIFNLDRDNAFFKPTVNSDVNASLIFNYNTIITDKAFTDTPQSPPIIEAPRNVTLNYNYIDLTSSENSYTVLEASKANSVEANGNYLKSISYNPVKLLTVVNTSASDSTSSVVLHNNVLILNNALGYGLSVGTEVSSVADDTISGISIKYNYVEYTGTLNDNSLHALFVGHNVDAEILHNKTVNAAYCVVYKHTSQVITSGSVSYNLSLNGSILCFGADGYKIYGNTIKMNKFSNGTCINVNDNVGGQPLNAKVKNNVLVVENNSYTYSLITLVTATGQEVDYNHFYTNGKAELFRVDAVDKTKAEWLALLYDANSGFDDSMLDENLIPSLGSPVLNSGVDLGSNYIQGLDRSTVWLNGTNQTEVVLKNQTGVWDKGAYV